MAKQRGRVWKMERASVSVEGSERTAVQQVFRL